MYSGLLAGCHAIVFDGTRALNLDGFAAVPAADAELVELPIAFGEEVVTYAIGPASCAVPGLPAALDALWRSFGRLPWKRLVEPALQLARQGVPLPPMHERSLEMLGDLYTLERGVELFAPAGQILRAGDVLQQPGLVDALEALLAEGVASVYEGAIGEAILSTDGVVLTRDDLQRYEARWHEPVRRPLERFPRRDTKRPVWSAGAPHTAACAGWLERDRPRHRIRRGDGNSGCGRRAHDEHGRGRR